MWKNKFLVSFHILESNIQCGRKSALKSPFEWSQYSDGCYELFIGEGILTKVYPVVPCFFTLQSLGRVAWIIYAITN